MVQTRFNWPHFIDEEIEAQRGFVTCSELQIQQVEEPRLELRSV